MEATQPHGTLGRTRLGFASTAEIDEFVRTLERYERAAVSLDLCCHRHVQRRGKSVFETGDHSVACLTSASSVLRGASASSRTTRPTTSTATPRACGARSNGSHSAWSSPMSRSSRLPACWPPSGPFRRTA